MEDGFRDSRTTFVSVPRRPAGNGAIKSISARFDAIIFDDDDVWGYIWGHGGAEAEGDGDRWCRRTGGFYIKRRRIEIRMYSLLRFNHRSSCLVLEKAFGPI